LSSTVAAARRLQPFGLLVSAVERCSAESGLLAFLEMSGCGGAIRVSGGVAGVLVVGGNIRGEGEKGRRRKGGG